MSTEGVELDDSERTPCEVWTRVMGYHRPVAQFNKGKQAEHAERKYFREAACCIPATADEEEWPPEAA